IFTSLPPPALPGSGSTVGAGQRPLSPVRRAPVCRHPASHTVPQAPRAPRYRQAHDAPFRHDSMRETPASRPVRMVDGAVTIDGLDWRYSVSDNLEARTWALNLHGFFAGGGVYWRESTPLAARLGLRGVNPHSPA